MISWKFPVFNANAEKCYEEISTLKEITPQSVLDYARNEHSELHRCFEWDDSIAAEKYRLNQARKVIQFMIVKPEVDDEYEKPTRVFQISSKTSTYKPLQFFYQNKDEYELLLERAKKELFAFKEKYSTLKELDDIIKVIDKYFEGENNGENREC